LVIWLAAWPPLTLLECLASMVLEALAVLPMPLPLPVIWAVWALAIWVVAIVGVWAEVIVVVVMVAEVVA
jgi:hypothetical protein